jgi:hypothetical protein
MIEELDLHRVQWCVLGLLLHEFDTHPSPGFVSMRQLTSDATGGFSKSEIQTGVGELLEWELISEELISPDESGMSAEPYYGITAKGVHYLLSKWDAFFDTQYGLLGDLPDEIGDTIAKILRLDEDLPENIIPASGRYVTLDHNSGEYRQAVRSVQDLIELVRVDNEYAEAAPDEREGVLATLRHGLAILSDRVTDLGAIRATLLRTAQYLVSKFGDAAIGAAATACLAAIGKLLGIF